MNQFNKNVMLQTQSHSNSGSPSSSSSANTTDALIINSNSTIVSDELILQLQEQFGDSKQIYILNTSNNSVSSSSSAYNNSNATNGSANSTNTIQYLIVDKDVDINAILQDPSLFQNQQTTTLNQQTAHQQQTTVTHQSNHAHSYLTNKSQNQTAPPVQQPAQQLLVEESIQRVQAPPPKRKQFEFKLDLNKRMSYQDAFLRYLAGEKQPTLEINTNDHANKKPKDNIYYNFYLNNPKLAASSSSTSTNQNGNIILNNASTNSATNNTNTINNNNNNNNNTTSCTIANPNTNNNNGLDKENYYNSSRRENLLPLNNYEYRNSYKDHYDNQGVRVNPAIFKNLPAYTSVPTTSISSSKTIKQNETQIVNNSKSKLSPKPVETVDLTEILDQTTKPVNSTLNDHTYKQSIQNIPKLKDDINLKRKLNDLTEPEMEKHSKLDHQLMVTPDIIPIGQTVEPVVIVDTKNHLDDICENITFMQGEFLIHRPTFMGDFDNYDIYCVLDDQYLQKYEPVLLSTGERCHQSADVLAQYTANKTEFLLVKVEEKGKTENNNIVVGVLPEYEPKNNPKMAAALLGTSTESGQVANAQVPVTSAQQTAADSANNVVVVTYDDLKSTFDVFLQVMSSQYLNVEFLLKVKEIQDEYFKPSIEFIDTILNEKYNLLFACMNNFLINLNEKLKLNFQSTNSNNNSSSSSNNNNCNNDTSSSSTKIFIELKQEFKYLLDNKPKLIIQKVEFDGPSKKKCESLNYYCDEESLICNVLDAKYLLQFEGILYDADTLQQIIPLNSNGLDADKQFFVCSKMCNLVNLLHSLKHFKYTYLEICSQKIESIKIQLNSTNSLSSSSSGENNSNTDLLNYCMADNQWLLEMFEKFKQLLFDVDNLLSNESSNEQTAISTPGLVTDVSMNMSSEALNVDKTMHHQHILHDTSLIEDKQLKAQ